ncbi:hypothetical protein NSQ20_11870 [Paenibacillus sp. FSL K6-1122]|uniref:hypothetical protein n=1 Tax=Paenibacillus sp. FSL K6-1122 TaxID=2954512 RepID=UPI0030EC9A36
MIEVGKTYSDALSTQLTVQKIDNNRIFYFTNYDEVLREASLKDFIKWTTK